MIDLSSSNQAATRYTTSTASANAGAMKLNKLGILSALKSDQQAVMVTELPFSEVEIAAQACNAHGCGPYLNISTTCDIPTSGSATISSDCILYSQIVVTGSLNITGIPDAQGNLPKIIGGGSNRLFKVESGGELVVKYLNLTGGDASTETVNKGGAVYVTGT
eukprot:g8102.t1